MPLFFALIVRGGKADALGRRIVEDADRGTLARRLNGEARHAFCWGVEKESGLLRVRAGAG